MSKEKTTGAQAPEQEAPGGSGRQAPPPEKESIKGQLEAGAKKAAKENAARAPKEKPAKAAER